MKLVEDEYTLVLDEIHSLSKKLNEAVDAATDKIESLEKRLGDAEPGVSVWSSTLLTETIPHPEAEGPGVQQVQRVVTLGYGRAKKKWGFMVREEVHGKKQPEDLEWTEPVSDEVCPLRKADRELRLLALPHLSDVVESVRDALKQRALRLFPEDAPVSAPPEEPKQEWESPEGDSHGFAQHG